MPVIRIFKFFWTDIYWTWTAITRRLCTIRWGGESVYSVCVAESDIKSVFGQASLLYTEKTSQWFCKSMGV